MANTLFAARRVEKKIRIDLDCDQGELLEITAMAIACLVNSGLAPDAIDAGIQIHLQRMQNRSKQIHVPV